MPNHDLASWQDEREDALVAVWSIGLSGLCPAHQGGDPTCPICTFGQVVEPKPVMQCQACGRGENGKHADDCAWLRGDVKP
jgi:uncharacterized protein (DUF983 family)